MELHVLDRSQVSRLRGHLNIVWREPPKHFPGVAFHVNDHRDAVFDGVAFVEYCLEPKVIELCQVVDGCVAGVDIS